MRFVLRRLRGARSVAASRRAVSARRSRTSGS